MTPSRLRSALRGIISFAPTPFTEDDEVDVDGVMTIVASLAQHGGPVAVCGAVGEYAALDVGETRAVIDAAVDGAQGAVPVIVGVGYGTSLARDLASYASRAGAAGILVNPFTFSEPSPAGLVTHHQRIADECGLGLIVFSTHGHVYSLEQLLRLAEIDNVIALKDEWGDLRLFSQAREHIGDRWAWINGMAEMQAAEYAVLGADAFTSGLVNVAPSVTLAVQAAIVGEHWSELRALATRIRPFAGLRARRPGYSTVVIKEAMGILGQPGGGRVRPPFSPLEPADRAELEAILPALTADASEPVALR